MDENVRQLIDTAIEREQAAYEFYMDIYNRISEPGVKDTIEWIAGEEKKHKAFLIDYRNSPQGAVKLQMSEVTYYKVAEYQEEPEIEADMNSADVYLVASHRELRSHQFYSELAEMHTSGDFRDMLLKMANEELKHKEKMEYLYANTAFPQTDGG